MALAFYTEALFSSFGCVSKKVWMGLSALYGTFVSNVLCVGIWTWAWHKSLALSTQSSGHTETELRLNRRPQPHGSHRSRGRAVFQNCPPEPESAPSLHLEFAIHAASSLMTFPDTSWMFFLWNFSRQQNLKFPQLSKMHKVCSNWTQRNSIFLENKMRLSKSWNTGSV